jgi:hypothetical protein
MLPKEKSYRTLYALQEMQKMFSQIAPEKYSHKTRRKKYCPSSKNRIYDENNLI